MIDTLRLSPALQDYIEVILELSAEDSRVRVTDIANRLNNTKASVIQALTTLKSYGLIQQDKYGPVILTPRGKAYATKVQNKHQALKCFLTEVLGVDAQTAEEEACLMEHAVSSQTMERLLYFLTLHGYLPAHGPKR